MKRKITLIATRVPYRNIKTPVKLREYKLDIPNSPVGTKTEWKKWAKIHKVNIKFEEY